VSKEFFEALLETFAREAEAGAARIILLVLDNAGWHGPANLKIPEGIRLIYLPSYSPELQPAETLWALSWTSRSSTSTWQPSPNSTRQSRNDASPSPRSESKSRAGLDSDGGQSGSIRIN
jgi:transposase